MPITAIVNIDGTSLLGGQKMVCLHVSSRKQAISCRAFGQFVSELCLYFLLSIFLSVQQEPQGYGCWQRTGGGGQ